MTKEDFILDILQKLENNFGCISFSYKHFVDNKVAWYWIAIDDYEVYKTNRNFSVLTNAWHKISKQRDMKLVFCCQSVQDKFIEELYNNNNLIMNV